MSPQASLDRAAALLRRGDAAGARAAAQDAVLRDPANPAARRLLGLACCHGGDLATGAAQLRRALELDPRDEESRTALAHALVMRGDGEGALALSEGVPGLLRLRAYILQEQGRFDAAARAYEAVVQGEPGDWEAWNNLGNARRDSGDAAGAVQALSQAARLRPEVAAIRFNLALASLSAGDVARAEAGYREAARLDPANPSAQLELGRLLRHSGRSGEAVAAFRRARELAPAAAEPLMEIARAHAADRRLEEAEAAYRRALALQPRDPTGWLELGIVLERGNRLDALRTLLSEAARAGIADRDLGYLHALALRREGRLEEAFAAARAAPAEVEPVRRWALIGRIADRLGDSSAAFDAYSRMNLETEAAAAATVDAEAYRRRIGRLIPLVTRQWYEGWTAPPPPTERAAPVFLVGFPRSGTTLLDTMMMGHPALEVLEEEPILQRVEDALGDYDRLPTLEADEVEALRQVYFEGLDALRPDPGRTVVDKLPLNILGAPLIHRLFPDAKFVFAQRHPCDVVLSGFMQDFELNDAMANFLRLEDAARLYDLVLTFWTRCRDILPLSVHTVKYEALVEAPEAQLRPLLDFLGLPWDERVLDHRRTAAGRGTIITPSYSQVVEPLYGQASGRWERYAAQLAPALPLLAPWAERLGYARIDLPA
jgi:Flp pilus assembly protein TadD